MIDYEFPFLYIFLYINVLHLNCALRYNTPILYLEVMYTTNILLPDSLAQ